MTAQPIIEAYDVVKGYGRTPALRGVSLRVDTGEVVAVTGASGSGKSTLLHTLAGILQPEAGEVWHAGVRIDALGEAERSRLRRTRFGMVFQFGQLAPELTAAENVALPLLLNRQRRSAAFGEARRWLERLGVGDVAELRPGEMSGGQAQLVAVARALVTDPSVVFADEPTGALDRLSGEQMLTVLLTAVRERDMTLVLVTHDPAVAAYTEREIILRDGQVEPAVVTA